MTIEDERRPRYLTAEERRALNAALLRTVTPIEYLPLPTPRRPVMDDPTIEEALKRLRDAPVLDTYHAGVHTPNNAVTLTPADRAVILASHASLEERVKEAKRLMKPFADEAAEWDEMGDTRPVIGRDSPITVAHLRALAAFVNEKET